MRSLAKMPYPILSSQAPVTKRPQTSRDARRAFSKRKASGPSEKDLKRIAREEKQQRLAAEKQRREKKRKENERKRAEEKEKERERIRQLGVEQVVKVPEGQMRIAGFFKARSLDSFESDREREQSPEKHLEQPSKKNNSGTKPEKILSQASDTVATATKTETLVGIPDDERGEQGFAERDIKKHSILQDNLHKAPSILMPPPAVPQKHYVPPEEPFKMLPPPIDFQRKPTVASTRSSNVHSEAKKAPNSRLHRKPLAALSGNAYRPMIATQNPLKRKALTLETGDDLEELFLSNTQVARELSDPVPEPPAKRQTIPDSSPCITKVQAYQRSQDALTASPQYRLIKQFDERKTAKQAVSKPARIPTSSFARPPPATRHSTLRHSPRQTDALASPQPARTSTPRRPHSTAQSNRAPPTFPRQATASAPTKSPSSITTSALPPAHASLTKQLCSPASAPILQQLPPKPAIEPEPDIDDFCPGPSTQECFEVAAKKDVVLNSEGSQGSLREGRYVTETQEEQQQHRRSGTEQGGPEKNVEKKAAILKELDRRVARSGEIITAAEMDSFDMSMISSQEFAELEVP